MNGRLLRQVLVLVVTVGLLAVPAPASTVPPLRYVVIMSFDGTRADALRAVMPDALLSRSASSWDAQTTLPSSTLPAHASMLTGVGPDAHGVTFNDWILARGYIARPTVFSVVTAGGKTAAAFVAKAKLFYLLRPGTAAAAEYLPFPANDQHDVVAAAVRYLATARPALLFIHAADPDAVGHAGGWMSARYMEAVRQIPASIAAVLDVLSRMGALAESLVIVTSDHGGHGFTHGTADPQDTTIPWLAFGAVRPGPIGRRVVIYDTAATALRALGVPVPSDWPGTPVERIDRAAGALASAR